MTSKNVKSNKRLFFMFIAAVLFGFLFSNFIHSPIKDTKTLGAKNTRSHIGMGVVIGADIEKKDKRYILHPFVSVLFCGSPAYVAGIQVGDKVQEINGERLEGTSRLILTGALRVVRTSPIGTPVVMVVRRGASEGGTSVTEEMTFSFNTAKIVNGNIAPDCSP